MSFSLKLASKGVNLLKPGQYDVPVKYQLCNRIVTVGTKTVRHQKAKRPVRDRLAFFALERLNSRACFLKCSMQDMKADMLVTRLVNRYIGVDGGYLGLPEKKRFTYRTHADFYSEFCGISKKPLDIEGTTRERFIAIYLEASPKEQSQIIRGSIAKFPVGEGPDTRTFELKGELLAEAEKLDRLGSILDPAIAVTSDIVFEALEDAALLIKERKAVSAVDRVHTAFHGYLRAVSSKANITYGKDDDIVALLKKAFTLHPKLQVTERGDEIRAISRGLASISHSLNPIRNHGSLAHANENLLDEPEAGLVINAVRTLMTYLDAKLR